MELIKYPRTPHLEGSRLQPGDEAVSQIPFSYIAGVKIVVEEKCDGANTALSFDDEGHLRLQSRGHYLTGGYRERHYNLMKQWAQVHQHIFFAVLGSRYILYGEWLYAKHTVFYDCLPHYFLAFDIFDKMSCNFLDTPTRLDLLHDLPIVSVPVLKNDLFHSLTELTNLLGQSSYIKAGHTERLRTYCIQTGENAAQICRETDASTLMEGLYIKIECGGVVTDRMKFVRPSFLQCVEASDSHWLSRPIIPNQLSYPVEYLFAPTLPDNIRTIYHA